LNYQKGGGEEGGNYEEKGEKGVHHRLNPKIFNRKRDGKEKEGREEKEQPRRKRRMVGSSSSYSIKKKKEKEDEKQQQRRRKKRKRMGKLGGIFSLFWRRGGG